MLAALLRLSRRLMTTQSFPSTPLTLRFHDQQVMPCHVASITPTIILSFRSSSRNIVLLDVVVVIIIVGSG